MLYDLPPPPQIAKYDLPSNHLYDLPTQITKSDLPSNCQVQVTLKSPVWFTPPPKMPSLIDPEIA